MKASVSPSCSSAGASSLRIALPKQSSFRMNLRGEDQRRRVPAWKETRQGARDA
jgi:hypothetical protein